VFFSKHNYNDELKEDEMGRVHRTNGERMNACRIFWRKPEGITRKTKM
jgi:hypothetical protein